MIKTYVFDEYEVKKTGRIASLPLKSGGKVIKVEITPFDETYGTWKKWVLENTLYLIEEAKQ